MPVLGMQTTLDGREEPVQTADKHEPAPRLFEPVETLAGQQAIGQLGTWTNDH